MPLISAIKKVWPALILTDGDTFQPCPSSRAALAPVPSVAIPALPFSPVKLSGLIDRVFASDKRGRLPMLIFKPLNPDLWPVQPVDKKTTDKNEQISKI
jgi:hypothetical protein